MASRPRALRKRGQAALQRRVDELARRQPWVHDIELPHGVRTCPDVPRKSLARTPTKWKRLAPIFDQLDLRGKRVLDVGCNEGFYSVEAARRGAEVVGLDLDPERIRKADFVKDELGLPGLEFHQMDIYGDDFEGLGRFDVCLALGFIHRIPDPLRAIERITGACDTTVYEWAVDRRVWTQPVAHYVPGRRDPGNIYTPNYWRLNPTCLRAILQDLGYDAFRAVDRPRQYRTILLAGRTQIPALRPRRGDVSVLSRPLTAVRLTREYIAGLGRTILPGRM